MPVRGTADALHLLSLAVATPLEHETLAFLLDSNGIGGIITVVSGTEEPDAVVDVVEVMSRAGEGVERARSLVVASVRPASGVLPGDVDRWLECSAIAEECGLQLVEWFVVGPHGVECPRDLLGEPERWPG
jgi:hypothetical protein